MHFFVNKECLKGILVVRHRSTLQFPFYSLLSMINVLKSLRSMSFLMLMQSNLVYCWCTHFSATLVREDAWRDTQAFSYFSFTFAAMNERWRLRGNRKYFALSICHSVVIRGDSVRRICHSKPSWIVSCMIALHFSDPIQLWLTYIYSVSSLLPVKRSAELILFLFI